MYEWTSDELRWHAAMAAPDWGEQVLAAFLAHISDHPLLEPVAFDSVELEPAMDGPPKLIVKYHHPFWKEPTALRRRLDFRPASGRPLPGQSVAEWLADWIANFDIAEPLGAAHARRQVSSDGYYWWGDLDP